MSSIAPRSAAALLALALLVPLAPGAHAALETADEIQDCVRENFPANTSRQVVTFRSFDRTGSETVSNAEIFWRKFDNGNRALVRFSDPPDLRGSSLLLIEKPTRSDMFMYLPELRKVRRVSKHSVTGSMFGTDFSYEDFERLQGLSDERDTKRLPDGDLSGRKVYVVEVRPAPEDESQYERIVSYVDQERCLPLRTELFEKGERLRKVMSVPMEKVVQEGKLWIPRYTKLEDLVDETHTELTVDEIEVDKELPRKLFSERELQRAGR